MGTITIDAEEFKKTLKTFDQFSRQGIERAVVTTVVKQNGDSSLVYFLMQTDHAFVQAEPISAKIDGELVKYSFDPTLLLKLSLTKAPVTLSWASESSPMQLTNGRLHTDLKVAVPKHAHAPKSKDLNQVAVPYGVMCAFRKYLDLQCSYYKAKRNFFPIQLQSVDGKLVAIAGDGGYSIGFVKTDIAVDGDAFLTQIPKYAFDGMFPKTDKDMKETRQVVLGVRQSSVLLDNGVVKSLINCLNERPDHIPDDITKGTRSSCSFNPSLLNSALKPLMALVPEKERYISVLKVVLDKKMSLVLEHKDTGCGGVDDIEGVEIYHEMGTKSSTVHVNPAAFRDYTSLFDVDNGKMFYCGNYIFYSGMVQAGGANLEVGYVFPTVQV